ncbi:MAG: Tic20 family protein [Cyanobacteria bacterium P01_C01_bin.121]
MLELAHTVIAASHDDCQQRVSQEFAMNGSATALDRAFAALAYVMPLTSALGAYGPFQSFLLEQAPAVANAFSLILLPLLPLIAIEQNQILGLAVFIVLFAFVVRNTSISRFIRYNVLQAILVSFVISVCILLIGTLGVVLPSILLDTFLNVLFLGGMAIVIYGVAQSVMGRYADIPTVSDAINAQLPY